MDEPVRVMLEHGKNKRVVASAFDWPGWDRNTKLGGDVLAVLDHAWELEDRDLTDDE